LKEKYYKAFLNKINLSNGIVIQFPKQSFSPYKYYIGKGNNSMLVRSCIKSRFWWSMGDFDEWDDYNFVWTQWKSNKVIATIKTHVYCLDHQKELTGSMESSIVASSGATTADSNSSAENLIQTPTKIHKGA